MAVPPAEALDAEVLDAEAMQICRRLAGLQFPWDLTRALELALLKTFCVPSISGLLQRTGEFEQRPRKRYDDTGLMVAELLRHGPDSAAGAAVLGRMNRIHGSYAIANADFLYVLSTFVAEPIRWLERYGWRALSPGEEQALFRFWRHVGRRMGIDDLPQSLEELLALNRRVEQEVFRPAASNRRIAEATLAMLLADWPQPLRPGLADLLRGLLEPEVTKALQWPAAPPWRRALMRAALRARSRAMNLGQRLRPPQRSRFFSERPTASYGASFQLEQLGPPAMLDRLERPRWPGPQRRIGLTGGIASGKSSVGAVLAARGLPVLDADLFAREALAPGRPATREVLARYGPPVQGQEQGSLDRAALGRIVFAQEAERRWLEALVHPLVRERMERELAARAEAPVLVLMIPLLFEVGLEGLCSEVWLVDCEEEQQLRRLMERDGLGEADARERLAAQWPLARKRDLADVVIDNRGAAADLAGRVPRTPGGRGQA
ncbi:MAG: dephospho-CoA kinase [Synechococcaceae cyanobacterium]|nr:dephospho-CoA kinase [Synechococcaceae cyanobacterium]